MDRLIAQNRFGLGARDDASANSLDFQIQAAHAPVITMASIPSSRVVMADYQQFAANRREARIVLKDSADGDASAQLAKLESDQSRRVLSDHYRTAVRARFDNAVTTNHDFAERLVHFWSNHFAISADTPLLKGLAGSFEQEAIRPHIFERFSDMMVAAVHHPAMQTYLDQWKSIGPNSPHLSALRKRGKSRGSTAGLNENLAREILELHSVGVRGGYTQIDVRQLAMALTGRTIIGLNGNHNWPEGMAFGDVYFDDRLHETGVRTVMGRIYANDGEGQAIAILRDLAQHPSTATFLATKLAQHFVSDTPPPDLVRALETAFLKSGGDLATVYQTLIAHKSAWSPTPQKYLTPWEWSVAAFRSLGLTLESSAIHIEAQLADMAHPVWMPKSPAGFADISSGWVAPSALMRRAQMAHRIAQIMQSKNGNETLPAILQHRDYSDQSMAIFNGAADRQQLIALALMAPEFLRR